MTCGMAVRHGGAIQDAVEPQVRSAVGPPTAMYGADKKGTIRSVNCLPDAISVPHYQFVIDFDTRPTADRLTRPAAGRALLYRSGAEIMAEQAAGNGTFVDRAHPGLYVSRNCEVPKTSCIGPHDGHTFDAGYRRSAHCASRCADRRRLTPQGHHV